MSFNIALSGINAAQKDLDVTANNIANVNTFGFKESRAEFADVYATSIFSNAKTNSGNGVKTAQVAQQFHQGSLQFTQNALDLAITGEGFFVTAEDTVTLTRNYTRAGAFNLNADNYVVNASGAADIIASIEDPAVIHRILACLERKGARSVNAKLTFQ